MSPRVDALAGPRGSILPHLSTTPDFAGLYEQGQVASRRHITGAPDPRLAPQGYWVSEDFLRGARAALDTLAELNGTTNTGDIYDATVVREIRRQQTERQTQ